MAKKPQPKPRRWRILARAKGYFGTVEDAKRRAVEAGAKGLSGLAADR
jgi:ribosomal protein L20